MKISKGAQFWTEHLAGVKREGLSLMAYAGKHGLRLKTLYHWSSKLKRAGGVKPAPTDSQFVALRVSQVPRVKSEPGCERVCTLQNVNTITAFSYRLPSLARNFALKVKAGNPVDDVGLFGPTVQVVGSGMSNASER